MRVAQAGFVVEHSFQPSLRDREVAGSNPVAPTFFRNEPFGENVEALCVCEDESYYLSIVFKSGSAMA
jgi:hypothetical protein